MNKKRVVIKVGTTTITHENGRLNFKRIRQLTEIMSDLRNRGVEVVFVTSGAIGVGSEKLGLAERPRDTKGKQAAAAVGQCELMNIYSKDFAEYGYNAAQILLTKDIVDHAVREENAKNTFNTLLELGAIPIVNENDTVATEEIEFGDNDSLSAVVAKLVDADLLILLSDIEGLYDKDPHKYKDAKPIDCVYEITDDIRRMAGGAAGTYGTGGMQTKIHAADIAVNAGIDMLIISGENPDAIYDIFDGKKIGTLFKAKEK